MMNEATGAFVKSTIYLAGTVFLALALDAGAQQTPVYSDIDCSKSKIAAPSGLTCRSTQEYNGGRGASTMSGAGGTFKRWTSSGTAAGAKLFYYLQEGTTSSSFIYTTNTLEQSVRAFSPQGKDATGFTQTAPMNGADYVRFNSSEGDACVGVRKLGPSRGGGYAWLMYATHCAAAGKSLSDAWIGQFIGELRRLD
jgi:hypothetical protein